MRKLDLCVLSLSLLLIPLQIAASDHHTTSQPKPIGKTCHVCAEEESTWLGDSATITPAPAVAIATPSQTDDCRACELHADR
ncbi:MAG: hypothetical protein MUO58_20000, partial [Anaerolineales bacterium]|nr:hypothetical protein [Anaerolineales bacterium]